MVNREILENSPIEYTKLLSLRLFYSLIYLDYITG